MLLQHQQNQVSDLLIKSNLDFRSFSVSFENYDYRIVFSEKNILSEKTRVYHFSIDNDPIYGYMVSSVPGIDGGYRSNYRFTRWKGVLRDFKDWLLNLSKELSIPDLWAEAAKTAQLFAPTAEPTDDKFTRTELAEVQGQLRLLQQSFTTAALPEPARQKLIELTQTAAVKAEGLSKRDWQNWIIGGFIGAITNLALNPTQAGEVLKLVKAAFGGLFLH